MKRRSLVLRVWVDEADGLMGHVSDPLTGWRQPFRNATELWKLITYSLADLPSTSSIQPELPDELDNDSEF